MIRSLPSLAKAADDCFRQSTRSLRTRQEFEAAIEVWNKLLDDAITNAIRAMDQYVAERRYDGALIARDMADYLAAMKATNDAPFEPGA